MEQNLGSLPSAKKSKLIRFCFSKFTSSPNFLLSDNLIQKTNTVKDLGITLSDNLKWGPYLSKIASKANIVSYNIIRSFKSTNAILFSRLFKNFVRPILEYNTVI